MLHTSDKIVTTKQAFKWLFEIKNNSKLEFETVYIVQRNSPKTVNLSDTNLDMFYWNYASDIQQIMFNCQFQNEPVKIILLIDNLQNRIFIDTNSAEQEQSVLKEIF